MRILEVIGSVDPRDGGAIEGIVRQAAVRVRHGWTTHLASLDHPQDPWVLQCPVTTFGLGTRPREARRSLWLRYGYSPAVIPWLRANHSRYDVIVVNGLWNYVTFASRRALVGAATPYVVVPHGMLDPWFRRAHPVKHLAKQLLWLAGEGALVADARAVLFTTEVERDESRDAFLPYRAREYVVGYGTADPDTNTAFDPKVEKRAFDLALPAMRDKPFLLFLGRIHPKKGCDLLVNAFTRIAETCSDLNLVMAGPDPTNWRPELEAISRGRPSEGRVHWLGMVSGAVKWGALRNCRALVLPSHQENFGVVVAEAMAAGRPVLISDKVNIYREVSADGAGLVCRDDADGVLRMLESFLAMPESAIVAMGRAARASFLARFEVETAAGKMNAVLEEVVARAAINRAGVRTDRRRPLRA